MVKNSNAEEESLGATKKGKQEALIKLDAGIFWGYVNRQNTIPHSELVV